MYDIGIEPRLDPPEPDVAFPCDWCGDDIYVGEKFLAVDGERLCSGCAEEYIDKHWETAEPEEDYRD